MELASIQTNMVSTALLKDILSSWPCTSTLLGNVYFSVILATILLFLIIGISLIVKYTPNILNDLKGLIGADIPEIAIKLWLAFILLIPIFFDAGPLWLILWWFIVLWGYVTKPEKRIAFVFISLIFMSGWIAHIGGSFLTMTQTHVDREIFMMENHMGSAKDVVAVASWIQKHPGDAEPINIQALIEKRKGNYINAVQLLRHALGLEPNNSRFYNHLGIALSGEGKHQDAINAFKASIAINPDNVIYHYNISRVYQGLYALYEAEKEIKLASDIDPSRLKKFLDKEGKDINHKFIEEHIPVTRLLHRQLTPSKDLKVAANALWDMWFGIIDSAKAIYLGIIYSIILIILRYIPKEKFTKKCSRCGNFYYVGSPSTGKHPMCLQCYWLDTKSKKRAESVMQDKSEEIKKHKVYYSSYTATLEMILPGMGSIVANNTLKGVARLCIISIGVILIITGGQFVFSFIPTGIDLGSIIRVIGVFMIGVTYWRGYKSPPIRLGV